VEVAKFTAAEKKKARQVSSNVKSMLIFFFDIPGIVHKEFFDCLLWFVAFTVYCLLNVAS